MELGPREMKWFLNLYPPFFFTRTKIKSIANDWREIVVELPKSIWTRNYVGTTFGGSLYAASDPFLMIMLIKILGIRDYIIWDKGATIDFKKPARSTLTYRFRITDADLARIHKELKRKEKIVPEFTVHAVDEQGQVCVEVKKRIYIRKKSRR